MATFSLKQVYDTTPDRLFALLVNPVRMLEWTPPEFGLTWVEQPETLSLGTVFAYQARRGGLSVRLVLEVMALEPPRRFAERQQRGPFRQWERQWSLREHAGQTELEETICVDPPGGLLGQVLTLTQIEADLQTGWQYREQRLRACLGQHS
ncbi:MAG: SRPBCC family protein [Gemmataceae bacterium]